ncbi:hypothetical protein [Nostoc sp. UHCC 0870]|uniref:hypothetical protein n=1 Tax=Nostoc sp. UHCC 0870 TaxID=2914041 RepID=UPI001EE04A48|nr:hypothetical protein [Nostoc sp. UHCC 0870]UKP01014.1 hypothetical protein L6494_28080 [Nostoc sp. UHCC 0870]
MQNYEIILTNNQSEKVLQNLITLGDHTHFLEALDDCYKTLLGRGDYWFETDKNTYFTVIELVTDIAITCQLIEGLILNAVPLASDLIWEMHPAFNS